MLVLQNKEGGAPTALPVGTEYGVPSTAVQARGGEAQVKVSADVADRFEAAKVIQGPQAWQNFMIHNAAKSFMKFQS